MGKSDKKDKKAEKERLKATETPEERYARRLAKKRKKHGEDAEFFGYKNEDNRFGDANLQEQFVWRKKIDKLVATGHDPRDVSREAQRDKKKALRDEIDRLKASREEREREKQMMEEERERLNREREALHFAEWERKEEEFHRQQAKTRTEIRMAKGRARPIDRLANNLLLDDNFDMDMLEPYKLFRELSVEELTELSGDMQQQAVGEFSEYWDSLLIICRDDLQQRESKQIQRGVADHGVHKAVHSDLDSMFHGKSCGELNTLAEEVSAHIESGGGGDVEYWESLMKRLKVHRAKALLRDISQDLIRKRQKKLQCIDGGVLDGGEARKPIVVESTPSAQQPEFVAPVVRPAEVATEQGDWSPELFHEVPPEDRDYVQDADEDWEEIKSLRSQIEAREDSKVSTELLAAPAHSKLGPSEDELYQSVVAAADGDDDSIVIKDEVSRNAQPAQIFTWHDKYRPRKPRYFNRVHTGYEWNKYNQTHYDHDNPPPKVVQGYKFNVFYPDLIDKTKAPEFFITKDPDGNKEISLLRIHAGPPYEDIAFKILNREWEYSHRHGYKCSFERGIFHLCFNFKKHRYRR